RCARNRRPSRRRHRVRGVVRRARGCQLAPRASEASRRNRFYGRSRRDRSLAIWFSASARDRAATAARASPRPHAWRAPSGFWDRRPKPSSLEGPFGTAQQFAFMSERKRGAELGVAGELLDIGALSMPQRVIEHVLLDLRRRVSGIERLGRPILVAPSKTRGSTAWAGSPEEFPVWTALAPVCLAVRASALPAPIRPWSTPEPGLSRFRRLPRVRGAPAEDAGRRTRQAPVPPSRESSQRRAR